MKPTSDILERINQSSRNHDNGVFTRLYRYLLREDVYFMAYQKLYANAGALTKCLKLSKMIDELPKGSERNSALRELKLLRRQLQSMQYTDYKDKALSYVRYADDWLIGVKGSKVECQAIKEEIKEFLLSELKLELSDEKTLITHSSQKVRFLGYDIMVRRNQSVRGYREKSGKQSSKSQMALLEQYIGTNLSINLMRK